MFVAYAIAAIAAAAALRLLGHDSLIIPVLVAIVGVHYWVFARVLHVWQYYVTSVLAVAAVAITLLTTNPGSRVGDLSPWILYPLLGNGVALFVTGGLMLAESARLSMNHKSV